MNADLLIGSFIIVCMAVGAYMLGYSDGKLSEREENAWKRLDELIRKVKS